MSDVRYYDESYPPEILVVPNVVSIAPASAVVGGPDITLTVTGSNLSAHSVILFNGGPEKTTFVPPDKVTTTVKPSTASGPGTVPVQVRNGVQVSNSEDFTFTVAEEPEAEGEFDPGEHTVAEVQEYIAAHPDDTERVLASERAGKNRTTLIAALGEPTS